MGGFAALMPIGRLNVALSTYAKGYRNNDLMTELLAPRVPVDRQSFQYLVFDRSVQRADRQTLRAPGDRPQSVRMTYSALPYYCQSHALEGNIPFESQAYAAQLGFNEQAALVRYLMDKMDLLREVDLASMVLNPAVVPNTQTLSGSSLWDNYSGSSHPIAVVEAAKAAIRTTGVSANTLILSDPVYAALISHPDIIERFKYTQPGAIGLDQLSSVFGVKCVMASAVVLDANNGSSFVWGTAAVLAYVQPNASQADLSALKTFVWTGAPETVDGYGVLQFPDPYINKKTNISSVDWYYDMKVTAPETLFVFNGCVQTPVMPAIAAPVAG